MELGTIIPKNMSIPIQKIGSLKNFRYPKWYDIDNFLKKMSKYILHGKNDNAPRAVANPLRLGVTP